MKVVYITSIISLFAIERVYENLKAPTEKSLCISQILILVTFAFHGTDQNVHRNQTLHLVFDSHYLARASDCHHLNVFFDVFVGFRQWRWYPFYICTLVCLLQTINALSSSAKHVHTAIDNATHRLNYGTIFKSMGNLHFSREYWLQTFRFKSQIKVETYNQSFTIIR